MLGLNGEFFMQPHLFLGFCNPLPNYPGSLPPHAYEDISGDGDTASLKFVVM